MRRALLCLMLVACEREPSFVGPWDVVKATRGGEEQVDVGFLDFTGERTVVVFMSYDHSLDGGFEPLWHPVYELAGTNVEAVDVETFYNERTPLEFLEIDGFGDFVVEEYTGVRTVFSGEVTWLGNREPVQTTLVLRR